MKPNKLLVLGLVAVMLLSTVTAHACRGRLLRRAQIVRQQRVAVVTRPATVQVYRRPLLRRWFSRYHQVPVATVAPPKAADNGGNGSASNRPPATIEGREAPDDDVIDIDDHVIDIDPDNAIPAVPSDMPPAPETPLPATPVLDEPTSSSIRGMRLWTDAAGQRQVRAEFASVDGTNVYLNTEDGRLVWTAMSELSRDDQQLIRRHTSQPVNWISAR